MFGHTGTPHRTQNVNGMQFYNFNLEKKSFMRTSIHDYHAIIENETEIIHDSFEWFEFEGAKC